MDLGHSAGTITFDIKTGKVLMVKEKNPGSGKVYWTFPKGHVEPKEKTVDTAIRETYEETNINVKIIRKVYDGEIYRLYNNVRFHKRLTLYAAIALNNNVKPQIEEVLDARFVFLHNAIYELKQNYVELIKPLLLTFTIISNRYPDLFKIH